MPLTTSVVDEQPNKRNGTSEFYDELKLKKSAISLPGDRTAPCGFAVFGIITNQIPFAEIIPHKVVCFPEGGVLVNYT